MEDVLQFQSRPGLLARLWSLVPRSNAPDPALPDPGPRYTYRPGMALPDARYHAVPGAVARAREAKARRVLRGGK